MCSFSLLFSADRSGTHGGPLVLVPICFTVWRVVLRFVLFTEGLLHISVLWGLLLPFYHLKPAWLFSSDILHQQGIFTQRTAALCIPFRQLCMKSPSGSEMLRVACHKIRDTFKVTYITLLPHSDACFKRRQVIFTMLTCLNELRCCNVIGWLDICICKQMNRHCQRSDRWVNTIMTIAVQYRYNIIRSTAIQFIFVIPSV